MMTTTLSFLKNLRLHFRRPVLQPSTVLLDRPHIFVLPTRSGIFFGFLLIIMLLGSVNYNNSMGYALTFLLSSMTLISILHTHRNLLGLRIETGKVMPVFVSETVQFQLWIDNRGYPTRYALIWQDTAFKPFEKKPILLSLIHSGKLNSPLSAKDMPFTIDIPADQRVILTLPVLAPRRGKLSLGPVTVYTTFPVGLFQAWSYIHLDFSTLVYPQPIGHKVLPKGNQANHTGEGNPHTGGGDDFIGYRNYQLGDSPRHLDWKAVARGQPWLIKQFGGLGVSIVWLTWEDVSHLNHLETALSQLCLWILIADSQGALYGLKIPGNTLEPNTGEQHREQCLQILALYGTLDNG